MTRFLIKVLCLLIAAAIGLLVIIAGLAPRYHFEIPEQPPEQDTTSVIGAVPGGGPGELHSSSTNPSAASRPAPTARRRSGGEEC